MARARGPIPFPQAVDILTQRCPRCAYDLAGLGDSRVCPECGVLLGPARVLCLVGVPRRTESKLWRRVAWIAVCGLGFVFINVWPIIAMMLGALITLLCFSVLLLGAIYLIATSRARSTTTEQITFSWSGIGRRAWGRADAPSELMDWPEEMYVRTQSISTLWQKVTVENHTAGSLDKRYFEFGFRCRRENLRWVQTAILALSRGEEIPAEGEEDPSWSGPVPVEPLS